MECDRKIDADCQRSANCNVMNKLPTLNVESENSFVKIGDEFNFFEKVLIVVPDDQHKGKAGQSDEKSDGKKETSGGDGLGKQFGNKTLNRIKKRIFGYSPAATRKVVIALIFVIAIGSLLMIAFSILFKRTDESPFEIPDYVNRSVWGSQPRKANCSYYPLAKPVSLVIIQHTSGIFCCNFTECQQSVKNSQQFHQSLPYYCDVRFGFLVGGDCRIYEGRNFSQRENVPNDPYYNWSVEVAFIGDYSRDQPTDCQIKNFLTFLKNSVLAGFLDKNFKVVGALQVYKKETKSPGKYLMDQIMKWDMWTNETVTPPT